MKEQKEIQCEYCTVRSNENKYKALEIEFHNCLNIFGQKKCPIYKLKQQLQAKEQECEELKVIINKSTERFAKDYLETFEENKKLKQTLGEIRKIVKKDCENCCECTTEFNLKESCSIYEIQDIINKARGKYND